MFDLQDRSRSDNYVCLAAQNRLEQSWNIIGAVLVVRIGVDDDICTQLKACVQSGAERVCEAAVLRKTDNMVDAVLTGNFRGPVGAAIIDDQPLDGANAGQSSRQRLQSDAERFCFVVTGNLNDQFWLPGIRWYGTLQVVKVMKCKSGRFQTSSSVNRASQFTIS
jgi:hypothetical protein